MTVKDYSQLVAWQLAMNFVEAVYRASKSFPKDEMFGLTSQMRRAAVSIPSNIAEGQSRNSSREFVHFLAVARGSLSEAETQVLIAGRLGYIANDETSKLLEVAGELGRVINGLSNAIEKRA